MVHVGCLLHQRRSVVCGFPCRVLLEQTMQQSCLARSGWGCVSTKGALAHVRVRRTAILHCPVQYLGDVSTLASRTLDAQH